MEAEWDAERRLELGEKTVMRRIPPPEAIGSVIAFLMSEGAYAITGRSILADGGMSIRDLIHGG